MGSGDLGHGAQRSHPAAPGDRQSRAPLYAALDLGTNNCRLLIASRDGAGFRVVDSFSRIVRLGEGLGQSGRLSDAAMARTLDAIKVCAERLQRRPISKQRFIATQACRGAENGLAFLARIEAETGLKLEIISTEEEARLAAVGCSNLVDAEAEAALVLDVGGGSTELSWIDPAQSGVEAWYSIPLGVVSLAERHAEPVSGDKAVWYRAMIEDVKTALAGAVPGARFITALANNRAHLIGTSGAVTSLAGVHLGLERYTRARVDGLWMQVSDVDLVTQDLLGKSQSQRAAEPCIGPERADLVLAGAAILQAVIELWPPARLRVADRGLREGVLLGLMQQQPKRKRRRRRARR